ncbi:hypothetical protein E4T48_02150 [Aureobasidium sp. EXF-10727]|nr:hypothetical protein E4T48_02150 [Aureobasidium sp. EXF-10727]
MNQSRKNTDSITAAQKHLQAASNLLLSTSPHASAFLASQLQQTKPPSTSQTNVVSENCRACGNIQVPGWSCTISKRRLPELSSKKKKAKSKVAKKPAVAQSTYVDYKCTLCSSINTTKSVLESKPNVGPPPVQTTTKPVIATTDTSSPAPSTAVSSSSEQARGATDKKRNRKQKLGGLQAMLAKSKAPSTTPKAFDFMDFMKTA